MKIKTIFASSVIAIALASCSLLNTSNDSAAPDMHSSENSLDWAGTYSGQLLCATCANVETELKLTSDKKYVLTQTQTDKTGEAKVTEGKFAWKGNHIVLDNLPTGFNSNLFKVEEGKLRMLDRKGNVVAENDKNRSLLGKNGNPEIEDKKWALVELYGKKIKVNPATHYVVFHSEDARIEAKAGCNQLTFGYKIKNGLVLEIEPGISTLMACADKTEDKFKNAMMEADNLSVNETTLTVNKGRMAPLAVFKIAE